MIKEKERIDEKLSRLLPWLEAGCHVLPLLPNTKRPVLAGGYKSASNDRNQVRAWLERWPNANWGVACEASNIFVVDCDYHEVPELSGLDQLGMLSMQYSSIPETYWQVTPSGGVHFFFRCDYTNDPLPSTVQRLAARVDTRGVGGYVAIPPSVIDGDTYEAGVEDWQRAIRDLRPTPRWIKDLLAAMQRKPDEVAVRRAMLKTLGDREKAQAVARIVEWLARVKEGERNNSLYWAACEIRDLGVDQESALRALLHACALNGLPEREATATVASAYRH